MPMRFQNSFAPTSSFGSGLQSLAAALFGPVNTAEDDARATLLDAQTKLAEQQAGLFSEKRRLTEGQNYARNDPRWAQWMTGATPDQVQIAQGLGLPMGAPPAPALPAPAAPPNIGPAPAPSVPLYDALRTQLTDPNTELYGDNYGVQSRGFGQAPIGGEFLEGGNVMWGGNEIADAGRPPDRFPDPSAGEYGLPAQIEELAAALLGNYSGVAGDFVQPVDRPGGAVVNLTGNSMGIPQVETVAANLVPAPPAATTPGPSLLPLPLEQDAAPVGPTPAAPVAAAPPAIPDDLLRRIRAALAAQMLIRMGDENVNAKSVMDFYVDALRNPTRERALSGELAPEVAGARLAATEPGKALADNSAEGLFNLYTGKFTDTSSPVIGAKAARDQAAADLSGQRGITEKSRRRELESRAGLSDERVNTEKSRQGELGARAGYWSERDRSPGRGTKTGKPNELSGVQRKALQTAITIKVDALMEGAGAGESTQIDSAVLAKVAGRAADLMRDDPAFLDDAEGAVEEAFSEIAAEWEETGTGWGDFWKPNRLQPKGSAPAAQSGKTVQAAQPSGGAPMPRDKAALVDGQVYATARGPARWNAKKQKFEQ